jgi:soluble lytic murein transglycosylase-like protein
LVKHKITIILALALFVCMPVLPARADIYQYTDEHGVLHFTNVSSGKNHKRVSSEPQGPRETAAPPKAHPAQPQPPSAQANIPAAYLDIINSACDRHGVDPSLVHAIVKVESDFNPYAMSRKGAMGLMQLMPQTAVNMNIKNSFNPTENIDGGVKYLRYLIDRYEGNLSLALAAYNSGETAVKRWGTIPPFKETQNYVKRILKIYNGGNGSLVTRYTIYMGYGDDGALLFTDNPSNHQNKNLKVKKKEL